MNTKCTSPKNTFIKCWRGSCSNSIGCINQPFLFSQVNRVHDMVRKVIANALGLVSMYHKAGYKEALPPRGVPTQLRACLVDAFGMELDSIHFIVCFDSFGTKSHIKGVLIPPHSPRISYPPLPQRFKIRSTIDTNPNSQGKREKHQLVDDAHQFRSGRRCQSNLSPVKFSSSPATVFGRTPFLFVGCMILVAFFVAN